MGARAHLDVLGHAGQRDVPLAGLHCEDRRHQSLRAADSRSSSTSSDNNNNNNNNNGLKFKAKRVESLKQFIENMHDNNEMRDKDMDGLIYTLVLKMLADVGVLLQYCMMKYKKVIPFFSLEDIIVIENEVENEVKDDARESGPSASRFDFVFINGEKMLEMGGAGASAGVGTDDEDDDDQNEDNDDNDDECNNGGSSVLRVDVPLQVNKQTSFLPLELAENELKHLPIKLTTTSWLYSLSSLCIYALLKYKFKNGEDDIKRVGRPFLHTSLYFCLKRCMKTNPEKRVLLYV
jgi:hypothetical protein